MLPRGEWGMPPGVSSSDIPGNRPGVDCPKYLDGIKCPLYLGEKGGPGTENPDCCCGGTGEDNEGRELIDFQSMTHQQRLLWLAEQEVECPRCGGTGTIPIGDRDVQPDNCDNCDGTGKVTRFPTLRQECRHPSAVYGYKYKSEDYLPCSDCQGRGWVPVDSTDATLKCASEWRFEDRGAEGILAFCRLTPNSLQFWARGLIHNEAAILALCWAWEYSQRLSKR